MNIKKNYTKGTRREILELLYMCGVVPEKSLRYIQHRKYKVMRMKISEMVKEGVLKYEKKNKLTRVLLINENHRDKERYEESLPETLRAYYRNYGKTDVKQFLYKNNGYEPARVFYNSDTMLFMYGIGIKTLAIEKDGLLQKDIGEAIYYNSKEIKNGINYKADVTETSEGQNISSSRLRGMVVSKGGIYGIYRMNSLSSYSQNGEYKMKLYLDRIVREKKDIDYETREVEDVVLIVDENKEKLMESYIEPEKISGKYSIESLEFVYKRVYGLPADENGQKLMKVFTHHDWRNRIINSFELPNDGNSGVVCDGYDGETAYYVFCIPDIKRFKKFLARAKVENNREKFVIICFDWQVDLVKKIAGYVAKIKSVPFDIYIKEMNLD